MDYHSHDGLLRANLFFPMWLNRLVWPLPAIAVFLLLASLPVLPRAAGAALAIYAVSLAPYVLVSYYDRYAAPLLGMKMLIVLYALTPASRRLFYRLADKSAALCIHTRRCAVPLSN